jgi:hypothetical protein
LCVVVLSTFTLISLKKKIDIYCLSTTVPPIRIVTFHANVPLVAMGSQLAFLVTQITFKPTPLPSSVRLDQQKAIITGSNVGISLETARQLASHGVSRIILGVRD